MKFIDLTGQKFNRLLVIEYVGSRNKRTMWKCKCDCGNEIIVSGKDIKSGHTKSCRCYQKEFVAKRNHEMFAIDNRTGTRLYSIWLSMKYRCENERHHAYRRYGKRGINVCEEWHDYKVFKKWAEENGYDENSKARSITLDRIDNNGNYEPNNCRLVDMLVQGNNRNNNHLLTIDGETKTLSQWAREYKINVSTFYGRIKRGWTGRQLLSPTIEKYNGYIKRENN